MLVAAWEMQSEVRMTRNAGSLVLFLCCSFAACAQPDPYEAGTDRADQGSVDECDWECPVGLRPGEQPGECVSECGPTFYDCGEGLCCQPNPIEECGEDEYLTEEGCMELPAAECVPTDRHWSDEVNDCPAANPPQTTFEEGWQNGAIWFWPSFRQ